MDALTGQELVAPVFTINLDDGDAPYVAIFTADSTFADNSPYEVVLVSTLGNYAQASSDPIFVTIEDPCSTTQLLS